MLKATEFHVQLTEDQLFAPWLDLYPHQREAVLSSVDLNDTSVVKHTVFQVPPGGGKTRIACILASIAARAGKKVLILVDQKEHAGDWMREAKRFTDSVYKVVEILGQVFQSKPGHVRDHRIVICPYYCLGDKAPHNLHSVRRAIQDTDWGMIVFDEAQNIGATVTYMQVTELLKGWRRLNPDVALVGLSASLEMRNTGVDELQTFVQEFAQTFTLPLSRMHGIVPLPYRYEVRVPQQKCLQPPKGSSTYKQDVLLELNPTKLKILVKLIQKVDPKQRWIVVVHHEFAQYEVFRYLINAGLPALPPYNQGCSDEMLDIFRAHPGHILIGLFRLVQGHNLGPLNIVFLATTMDSPNTMLQLSGRAMRGIQQRASAIIFFLIQEGREERLYARAAAALTDLGYPKPVELKWEGENLHLQPAEGHSDLQPTSIEVGELNTESFESLADDLLQDLAGAL